jgi:hypothetical protein
MFDKKFTEEDSVDKWEMRGAKKAAAAAPVPAKAAPSEGMWGRKATTATTATTAAGGSFSDLTAILRRYPVVYKPIGENKYRVEFFNKKIEELAGGRSFHQIQLVKDDVKAQLIKDLGAKVSISEAPRGFVFDFTVV